jgi:hypothetical protein
METRLVFALTRLRMAANGYYEAAREGRLTKAEQVELTDLAHALDDYPVIRMRQRLEEVQGQVIRWRDLPVGPEGMAAVRDAYHELVAELDRMADDLMDS